MADNPISNPYFKVFQSSNLHNAKYDPETKVLSVWFGNGSQYDYSPVPVEVWSNLISASSAGQYFAQFIKPSYRSTKVII